MEIAMVSSGMSMGIVPIAEEISKGSVVKGKSMLVRKYVIETRRYIGEDGKTTFDKWITNANVIDVRYNERYIVFYPLEGDRAGKKHYIPFSNVHVVREL